MKTRVLSILMVAAIFLSIAAIAQPGTDRNQRNQNGPVKKEMMMKRKAIQNNNRQNFFTEEQKEVMKTIHLETAKQMKPLKNELGELQARQETLTTANDADLKAINKNIDKMAEVKAEVAKIVAKQHQDFRAMLSDEQLIKFDNFKKKGRVGENKDFIKHGMKRGVKTPFSRGV